MTKIIEYSARGYIVGRDLRAILGRLLYEERWKRCLKLAIVSNMTGIQPKKIDNVELARGHIHWGLIKKLMDFYGKQMIINLIDVEKKEK